MINLRFRIGELRMLKGCRTYGSQRSQTREPEVRRLSLAVARLEACSLGTIRPAIAAAEYSTALKIDQVIIQAARVRPDWAILPAFVRRCLVVVVLVVNHVRRRGL